MSRTHASRSCSSRWLRESPGCSVRLHRVGQVEPPFGLDHVGEQRQDVSVLLVELKLHLGLVALEVLFAHPPVYEGPVANPAYRRLEERKVGEGPHLHERPAHDGLLGDGAEDATVRRVLPVVAHHPQLARAGGRAGVEVAGGRALGQVGLHQLPVVDVDPPVAPLDLVPQATRSPA